MNRARIKHLAATFLIFGLALSARAQTFTCLLIRPPDHDWTIRAGSYQFGIKGYGSRTEVYYGHGSSSIPIPFVPLVAGTGIGCLAACGISALTWKRKKRDDVA